ncbi:hypothetical protein B0H19DRAFT_1085156 [Mycena capillaripes]|nr:hypothetical protein B0H19DRAFT_1085156 [Mycena capillaripes]
MNAMVKSEYCDVRCKIGMAVKSFLTAPRQWMKKCYNTYNNCSIEYRLIYNATLTTHLSPRKPSRLMHDLNMGFSLLQLPPWLNATIPFTCGRCKTLINYLAGCVSGTDSYFWILLAISLIIPPPEWKKTEGKSSPQQFSVLSSAFTKIPVSYRAHYGDLPLQCNRAVVARVASVSTTLPEGNRELYP